MRKARHSGFECRHMTTFPGTVCSSVFTLEISARHLPLHPCPLTTKEMCCCLNPLFHILIIFIKTEINRASISFYRHMISVTCNSTLQADSDKMHSEESGWYPVVMDEAMGEASHGYVCPSTACSSSSVALSHHVHPITLPAAGAHPAAGRVMG